MNAERRKLITQAIEKIGEARSILEQAQADEQDYFDNMPESLQGGEKGETAQANVDAMQEALDSLESAEGLEVN